VRQALLHTGGVLSYLLCWLQARYPCWIEVSLAVIVEVA
jgi:hypothetical protein